jgi:hypothetical protein
MGVHESVLRQLLDDSADLTLSEAAEIAYSQAGLLQRCYQRHGGWNRSSERYEIIFDRLNEKFAKEKKWAATQPRQWKAKDADKLGVWEPPTDYGFLAFDQTAIHQNQLRKASEPHIESFQDRQQSARGQHPP